MATHVKPIETLDAVAVALLQNTGELVLIDVREPAEYAVERIPGALLYPLSTFDTSAVPGDVPQRVVFHCGSGKRSLVAAERCIQAGRAHAAHMAGGIAAWKAAGLPVIKPNS